MVEPDTVVRWHRSAWRAYWRWKSRRGPGRPHIPAEWQRLILRIATEHPRWGAVRIVGELRALGCEVSARTVSRYRQQALRRPPSQSWRTFLRNHASSIWAADRFTVQTLTFRTLSVFVVIDHDRRRIRHWNVTEHPNAPWIWRQMIEATAWGQQPGFLIRDRDRSYGGDFIARARRLGIETILTPVRAPNANAIAERVIGTLRRSAAITSSPSTNGIGGGCLVSTSSTTTRCGRIDHCRSTLRRDARRCSGRRVSESSASRC